MSKPKDVVLVGDPNDRLSEFETASRRTVRWLTNLSVFALLGVPEPHDEFCRCSECRPGRPRVLREQFYRGTFADGTPHPNKCSCATCARWRKQTRSL